MTLDNFRSRMAGHGLQPNDKIDLILRLLWDTITDTQRKDLEIWWKDQGGVIKK